MSRWLQAKVTQEALDNYNFNNELKTVSVTDQPDLFSAYYNITHDEVVEDSKEYDVTIYEQKFEDIEWKTKEQLKSTMVFDKLVATKILKLSNNLIDALNQIKDFLYQNSNFLEAFKVIVDDAIYYMVNCSEGSKLGMELCKDEDSLAGKLLDCIIRARKNKGM